MKPIDEAVVAMSEAHANGDVDAVRELLAAWPKIERLAPDSTWLHRAAEAGQAGLIDFWLDRGWDVNHNQNTAKSEGESTPLHFAKDAATTRHLLKRGARVNAWCRFAGTPLHSAVVGAVEASQRGRRRESPDSPAEPIRVLLEAGADPSLADFEGLTPLAMAVQLGRKTAEKVLCEAGAPEKGRRPPKQPKKAPAIDLSKDARRIASLLTKAIQRFARKPADRPLTGLFLAVSGIEGYAMVAFDVAGESNPWDASHSEYARVEFPKWRDAYTLSSTGVRLTEVDGKAWQWTDSVGDAEFEKPFFRAAVVVLELAQRDGAFEPLDRTGGFMVGVEATLGDDGRVWQPGKARNRR